MTLRRVLTFTAIAALVAVAGAVAHAWSNGVRFYAVESGCKSPAVLQGHLVVAAPTTVTATHQVEDLDGGDGTDACYGTDKDVFEGCEAVLEHGSGVPGEAPPATPEPTTPTTGPMPAPTPAP